MNKAVDTRHPHAHAGGWVPRDQAHVARWVQRLRQAVTRQPRPLVAPIAGLKALVEQDPLLHQQAQGMFDEAWQHEHSTPLGQVQVRSFDEFLQLLNGIMTTAPDDDSVIANACESAPLQVVTGVRRQDAFWLKGQPYSLDNLLDFDPRAAAFEGGTLYQAFLSALSYHRWHSPVSGTVRSVKVVNGSYYLANRHQGFDSPAGPDPSAPNQSQPFLTAVATRALIFIEADNPKIGLMCVVPVGMAEVSSCEVTVQPGQRIAKGEQLGMFHFGGSTHCLLFRPGVELAFDFYGQQPGLEATNLRINTALARVK
ncbi:phophatidylserine decarboxylase associated domain-containing protein [Aeromonas caviae]|uniref:phophatidylserine decarboxylase associated domain-containing protein n=1 Tax=Aeromonas caviae TaxID=648 RepID=UPI003A42F036